MLASALRPAAFARRSCTTLAAQDTFVETVDVEVDDEVIEADRFGCGFVRYEQASTNLLVTVKCESEETKRPPNPRAFVDPDAPRALLLLGRREGS